MSGEWQKALLDEQAAAQMRRFNRELQWMLEFDRQSPSPPLSWRRRKLNRARWWIRDNVSWRFARRYPGWDE